MKLEEFISYEQPTNYIVHRDQYTEDGRTPVLTAGQSFILGYTDEEDGIYNGEPVVIFDDFTTSVQYVDFPFKVKSSAMKILKNKANANIKFCYYLLLWFQKMPPNHKRQWISTTSQIDINLPSLTEQEAIVKKIEAVSNIIKHRNEELSELDNLIKARFVEMFGNPDTNIYGWDTYKMEQLCNVGSSKRIYQNEQSMTGVPFLRISDLVNRMDNGTEECDLYIPEERYAELKEQGLVPSCGDILLTARGTLGRCYIIKENDEFYFQDGMITWLSNYDEKVTALYIAYLFDMPGFRKQIDALQAGSTVAYLSISMTKKLDVMLPPIEIQEQFADFVKQVDKSKVVLQNALEETKKLFDSLMQKYFG